MLLCSAVLVVVAHIAAAQPATNAQPQGGRVVAGTASIGQTATLTQVNQASQRAAVDWNSFDVGSKQQVQFQQPSPSAMTLNRVTGADPSQIAGKITANGQIVLVNPAGVLFAKGAQVQAQSVVVSAAGISNQNFMAGRMVFDQPARPDAAVVNQGRVTVKQTGLAALVAPRVENDGVISARLGHVVLGGAETATLDLYGDGLLSIDVTGQIKRAPVDKDGKVATALVTNTGTVLADGGTVLLTASAVDGVVQTLVTAGGTISAPSVGGQTGRIAVRGTGGAVLVTGGVLAQGQQSGTTGGQIEVNATGAVTLASTARVDASGQAGGGTIAVGTTLARAKGGPGVTPALTAANVAVAAGAMITADATGKGNGGRVTVLSTQSTSMAGAISGKGGPTGGDGGFVEVSGSTAFSLTGPIDVSAPLGQLGSILLDPTNLTVVNGQAPVCISASCTYSADQDQALTNSGTLVAGAQNNTPSNQVSNGAIGALTGNIELQATNNLDVTAPIALAGDGQGLTLRAGNNLTVDSGVAITTSAGAVVLTAGDPAIPGNNPAGQLVFNGSLNTVAADASAADASLSSGTGGIALGGSLNVGTGTLTVAGGPIKESATASIIAGNLQSSGVVSGTVSLLGTNSVTNLGNFAVGGSGNFALTDNIALNVSGTVSVSGNNSQLYLQSSGGITIGFSGAIQNPGSNATASFQTDSFSTSSGFITSPNVELAPNTPNSTVTLGGTGSGLLLPDLTGITASTVRIGAISVPATTGLTTTAGSIVVAGAFGTSGITLELDSNGQISGSGALTANTLTGRAVSRVILPSATNAVSNLGAFTAGTEFALNNGSTALQITGPIGVVGNNAFLSLTAGPITQTAAGTITAANLGVGSSGAVDLSTATNAIGTLVPYSVNGDFKLNNGITPLFINSFLNVGANTVALTAGPITQAANTGSTTSGAPITAGTLTGSSSGAVDLSTVSNAIGNLGAFTAGGDFALNNGSNALQITAPVNAAGHTVTLNAGAITQTAAGAITAGTLTGSSSGAVDLSTATNAISNLGAFTPGGNFALNNGSTALQITGAFAGGGNAVTLTAGALGIDAPVTAAALQFAVSGAVSQSGAINVGTLSGSAASINLDAAGNAIGTFGSLQGQNSIAIATAGNIVLYGAVATPDLRIDANGTITQTGGSLAVGTLSGSALHLANFATNASVANLRSFTVTGSEFVLNDTGPLTIAGPLSAQYIAITALDQVTLTGTIATLGLPLAQQSSLAGTTGPGSYITVLPGTTGTGVFTAAGGAAIVPLGGPTATLRIGVPGAGGQIAFSGLVAPNASLVLDIGDGGVANGTLDVAGLLVLGSHHDATLFGTVDGFGSFGAAFDARIEPNVDPAYTINGCAIGSAACLLTQDALLALIAQVSAAANPAIAADNLTSKSVVAVPPLPAPFGGASDADSGDLVPPNISTVDY